MCVCVYVCVCVFEYVCVLSLFPHSRSGRWEPNMPSCRTLTHHPSDTCPGMVTAQDGEQKGTGPFQVSMNKSAVGVKY